MPPLSNMVFDNVVRNWLYMTVEGNLVTHDRLGLEVGRCMGMLYKDGGLVGSQDLE